MKIIYIYIYIYIFFFFFGGEGVELLINYNRITLVGQIERPCTTDRVSNLKSREFIKLSTYNVLTLLRPGRLYQLIFECKALNLDVVAIQ